MAYDARTQDALTSWWITGTGSVVNRLSEVMDDMPDGPAIYHMNADNAWTAGAGTEWYVATTTKPDNVADNLAGWSKLTGIADDQMGSLNADEWTFDTVNSRVYVRLSDSSDPNATDMRKHYAWSGSGAGPAVMTENIEDRSYQIHFDGDIGDGSTATTLTTKNEFINCDTGVDWPRVKAAATFTGGESYGSYGINGSYISLAPSANMNLADGGTVNFYDCRVTSRVAFIVYLMTGNFLARMSSFTGVFDNAGAPNSNRVPSCENTMTTYDVKRCNFVNMCNFGVKVVPDNFEDNRTHACYDGIDFGGDFIKTVPDLGITSYDRSMIFNYVGLGGTSTVNMDDPKQAIADVANQGTGSQITRERYTVNIHLVDKDGGAIPNTATILCTRADVVTESAKFYKCITAHTSGVFATDLAAGKWEEITDATILSAAPAWLTATAYVSAEQEFSVNPTSGDIAEQTITYKVWTDASELETKYIHTFTFSETDYETLTKENKTVTAPVVWHVELQQQKQPPAAWQEGVM